MRLRLKIFFIVLTFLPMSLFSCALCALYTPSATVSVSLEGTPNLIRSATFQWHFTQDFITTLVERYDENGNKKLDPDELKRIEIILSNYIAKKNYLTAIEYTDNSDQSIPVKSLKLHVTNKAFFLKESGLVFQFTTELNQTVRVGDEFSFSVEDNEGFFRFLIHKITHTIEKPFALESNLNSQIAFIKIVDEGAIEAPIKPTIKHSVTPKEVQSVSTQPSSQTPHRFSWLSWLKETLQSMQQQTQQSMSALKAHGSFEAYALFLATSFLYGLLHAAGPGHGKTLVGSYLFATHHRYSKALSMAALIGVVHTFSALLLSVVIYAIFDLFFNTFFTNVALYTTKVSASIIIGIVLYLGYQKIRALNSRPKIVSFSTHPFTCNCAGCSPKSQSSDWGVVLSASIVPCPGTVAIFIFALNTGAYLLGFLAALAMSFGMSSVIALASFSTLFVKHKFKKSSPRFLAYGEFLSLAIMFALGVFLLLL